MKRFARILAICLCLAAISVVAASVVGCGNSTPVITVSGSSSVTPVMEKLAAEYEKTHDVRITINMSSSGTGISDTQSGLNDFGMSSRALKEKETGVTGQVLCRDGIALIVNKNSQVTNVTSQAVKDLFVSGQAIEGTGITAAIGRDASSGTRSAFDELLKIEGDYHKSVATLAETGNVIEAIQNAVNSIGYISFGSLNSSVKAVSLDGVVCSVENVVNGSYALQRPFVIVLKEGATLSPAAQEFFDYIMSAEAQAIITAAGYVSVK